MAEEPREPGSADRPPTELEQNLKSRSTWLRLLFMILFVIIYGVSRFVLTAVVIIQFLTVLFTGKTNERLLQLGGALATYTYQMIIYLCFNTERRPFPFDAEWPVGPP